jgi:pyrroline-5-carboxylate reductase
MSGRIAILGAGKMGEALIAGLLSSGWRRPDEIVAADRRPERLEAVSTRFGATTTSSNAEAVTGAEIVVIAVKPQDMDALLADIGGLLTADQTVLSIAAAIPTAAIEEQLGAAVPVVRAMPNTPATVHEGMAGIAAGAHAGDEHLTKAEELLAHVGRTVRVPESYMDAVTGSCSACPARSRPISSSRRCSAPPSSCGTGRCIRSSSASR